MTKTMVRPELDLKKIAEHLDLDLHSALEQAGILDQRAATGHELSDSEQRIKLNWKSIASDCRDALHRIELGTYGLCLQCDAPIDEERLRQYPYAPLCMTCKKKGPGPGASPGNDEDGSPAANTPVTDQEPAEEGASKEGGGSAGTPVVNAFANPSSGALPTSEVPVPPAATTDLQGSPSQEPTEPAGAGASSKQFGDLSIPHANRGGEVDSLPVAQIKPSKKNPRTDVGDVSELAMSIGSLGLLQPLVVVKNGEGYDLVAGHRRLAAVKELDWKEVPVVVFNLSEKEQLEAMLIENIQRSDITALEEANAYQQLIEIHGMSQRELSDRIGRSQSHISKRISLMGLPPKAAELVDSGGITHEDAQKLLKLKDNPKRMERALANFDPKSSYRTLEKAVNDELKEIKVLERARKLRAKIKDEGLTVIAHDKYHAIDYKKRAEIGDRYGHLEVDLAEHKLEECHRVIVEVGYTASATHVCIDVARHGAKGKSKLKGKVNSGSTQRTLTQADKERSARQKRHQELESIRKKRTEFVKGLLSKKVSREDAIDLMALAVRLGAPEEMPDAHSLCDAFGLKHASAPGFKNFNRDEAGRTAADVVWGEFASKPENKFQIIFACALHVLEGAVGYAGSNHNYGPNADAPAAWLDVVPYLEWLEKKGYTITEVELEEIGKAAKAVEDAKAAAAAKKKTTKKGAAA